MKRSVLYVGPLEGTCLQRAEALRSLGHEVVHVESGAPPMTTWTYQLYRVANRLHSRPDVFGANRAMLRHARGGCPDIVWVDKGLWVRPGTLRELRRLCQSVRLVSYSPDDMMNPSNQSEAWLASIPLYDLHVTTKSFNVRELRELGARDVLFVDNAYDPAVHRPLELGVAERERYAADLGFVGHYEEERAEAMLALAREGMRVSVRGPLWRRQRPRHENLVVRDGFVEPDEYAKVVNATKINLGFLRKENRDLQTTRSVEIPACGGFMLAERTREHRRLFEEGVEAEFFDSLEELTSKCRYYLEHEDERARIAAAGLRRCVEDGYSNQARLAVAMERAQS